MKTPVEDHLEKHHKSDLIRPASIADIPGATELVYILLWDGKPIVIGSGKSNRARVLFDDAEQCTVHLKSLVVRLHQLYGGGERLATRLLVRCDSAATSKAIESTLHRKFGGNETKLPQAILDRLFKDIAPHSTPWLLLHQALLSAYDGQSDLKRWRKHGLIADTDWTLICGKLSLRERRSRKDHKPGESRPI
jgi:hypothetical protein